MNLLHVDPDPCESEHRELARLTDENANLRAAVQAVRELHRNDTSGDAAPADPGMCEVCMYEWPCPTICAISSAPAASTDPAHETAAPSPSAAGRSLGEEQR